MNIVTGNQIYVAKFENKDIGKNMIFQTNTTTRFSKRHFFTVYIFPRYKLEAEKEVNYIDIMKFWLLKTDHISIYSNGQSLCTMRVLYLQLIGPDDIFKYIRTNHSPA